MKISVFELEHWERSAFEALAQDHEVRFEEAPLDQELAEQHRDADVVSTFIYSDLGVRVLETFESLQLVATRSTGVDHIDAEWCADHGVTVCNVPTYGSATVAEHVFALLLALGHQVVEAVDRTRRGDFSHEGLRGFDLRGKTIGVIGTGEIGRHTIRIANGFGMDVIAADVEQDDDAAEQLGFRYVDLEKLLAESDVVSLHVPGGEATRHMIGPDEFDRMKRGVVLINTSRGSVIDTGALLRALSDGTVAAAGIDVIEEEPVVREEAELLHSLFNRRHDLETLLADHILLRMRNVIITPHTAFNTTEAVERILEITCENIAAHLEGERQNVIA